MFRAWKTELSFAVALTFAIFAQIFNQYPQWKNYHPRFRFANHTTYRSPLRDLNEYCEILPYKQVSRTNRRNQKV